MGWSNMEETTTNKGNGTITKIILAIIACLILMILLILMLLLNVQSKSYIITVDGISTEVNRETLLAKDGNITYVNIEEFAKLVKYEYHKGEYKAYTIENNKCYVQGANETASFYLNDNKLRKLPLKDFESDYREITVENTVKEINGRLYAPLDAISVGFNVQISEDEKSLTVITLQYLVDWYNNKAIEWGYTGILDQKFENQKSVLYGYLIVRKENGLYKVVTVNNEEVILDKYNIIEFSENTKEFFVTNSLQQVGIINLDGTTKIEPVYDSISVLDKKSNIYLIAKNQKYGAIKSGDITIISPEYDKIGLDTKNIQDNTTNKFLILDTLIPVCKNNKWGAYNKEGKLIYNIEYDGFGCEATNIEINGRKEEVLPILYIQECGGVVVKQNAKYGLIDINGKTIIQPVLDKIYIKKTPTNDMKYYMIFNNQEINVLDRLILEGIIEGELQDITTDANNIIENSISNSVTNNMMNNMNMNTGSNLNNIETNNSITVTLTEMSNQLGNNIENNIENNIINNSIQ